jgi:hypothetical protein
MPIKTKPRPSRLYEVDETAWLEETARLVRRKCFKELDRSHLAEYLEDMARGDRREVMSRLETLMMQLLKQEHQSWLKTAGWEATVRVQRHDLQELLSSKTLRNYAEDVLAQAYSRAVVGAAGETGLDE